MNELAPPDGDDPDEDRAAAARRRWNNRPEELREDDFLRGGSRSQPTPTPSPEPSRNPDRDWGAVLAAAGAVVLVVASLIVLSLAMGGLVGVLTVPQAIALTIVLGVIGAVGVYRGRRIYRGR